MSKDTPLHEPNGVLRRLLLSNQADVKKRSYDSSDNISSDGNETTKDDVKKVLYNYYAIDNEIPIDDEIPI
jgi:hypothetical protein